MTTTQDTTAGSPLGYRTLNEDRRANVFAQTAAIFLDAYREMNARRMFWIVLVISLLVVATFMIPGINERGITLFKFEFPGAWNTHMMSAGQFYKAVYAAIAIPYWLAWAAIILALISTASIFPDFLAGGSVDLYLSKPISRLRLFITKYMTGLLFVTLQVTLFSACSFVGIGIRGGTWEPSLFLAVPIVVLLFSYLYAVCVLIGVMTRSTMAAILITLIAWIGFWAVDQAEHTVLFFQIAGERKIANYDRVIANDDQMLTSLRSHLGPQPTTQAVSGIKAWEYQRDQEIRTREDSLPTVQKLEFAHNVIYDVKTFIPKTGETTGLIARWLTSLSESAGSSAADEDAPPPPLPDPSERRRHGDPFHRATEADFMRHINARSVPWIVGTSLCFEGVLVGLSAWTFCRRDY